MNKRILTASLVFLLLGCTESKAEPTIEERVLMEAFASYQGGLVYNEYCNKADPKERYDFKKKENAILMGNEQVLALRVGGLQHIRFPNATVDELIQKLLETSKIIKEKTLSVLEEKGCDSSEGQAAKKAYDLYSQVLPPQLVSLINQQILKEGGTVTSMEEIEKAISNATPDQKQE